MRGTARTVPLFGLDVRAETLPEAVAAVDAVVRARRPTLHVVLNALKASEIAGDPAMRDLLRSFDMVHADGTSIVWAARILGRPLPERVAGIDLFVALLGLAAERGYRPYLLGARREVVEEVARRVEAQHAGLKLAGWRDGYWDANDPAAEAAVVAAIRDARPDLLFVAMPTPRKELFLARYREDDGRPVCNGRRRVVRRAGRQGDAGAALDAARGPGVVPPLPAGAAQDVEALPRHQQPLRVAAAQGTRSRALSSASARSIQAWHQRRNGVFTSPRGRSW